MKTQPKRSAISQSMDLFIIIAAVLGVGGVVTASVYGLVNSGSSQYNIQLVQASLTGAASASSSPSFTLTYTVKNIGSQTISLGTTSTTKLSLTGATFTGAPTGVTCPSTVPTSVISTGAAPTWGSGAWSSCTVASPPTSVTWTTSGSPATLGPGQQVTFTMIAAFSLSGGISPTMTDPVVTGSTYTLSLLFGTAPLSTTLTSF